MAWVTFDAFGRGSSANTGRLQTAFDTLRTAVLSTDNLAPRFGLQESHIAWSPSGGHNHRYGRLGPSSVTVEALDDNSGFWLTDAPGLLCLFGQSKLLTLSLQTQSLDCQIDFASCSTVGGEFPPGTTPAVYTGVYVSSTTGVFCPIEAVVYDVTYGGFRVRAFLHPQDTNNYTHTFRIMFIAFGTPAGLLSWPAPMGGSGGVR